MAFATVFGVLLMARAGTALVVSIPDPNPDAIVSLASHEWERLPVAARLALQHPAARVLLTEPPIVSRHNCHDCGHRVEYLVHLGVAANRIRVIKLRESSTLGEATAVHAALRDIGVHRVLVVTSPYHTRRALAVFQSEMASENVRVGVAPAFPESPATPSRWWVRAYDRWYVSYEWLAIVMYRVKYHISVF